MTCGRRVCPASIWLPGRLHKQLGKKLQSCFWVFHIISLFIGHLGCFDFSIAFSFFLKNFGVSLPLGLKSLISPSLVRDTCFFNVSGSSLSPWIHIIMKHPKDQRRAVFIFDNAVIKLTGLIRRKLQIWGSLIEEVLRKPHPKKNDKEYLKKTISKTDF